VVQVLEPPFPVGCIQDPLVTSKDSQCTHLGAQIAGL
jgi:hypothetical protein